MNINKIREEVVNYFNSASIVLTNEEKENIEVADFGLKQLETYGLQLITYVNNERYCAKEMVLFPHQICPEHRHPTRKDGTKGKQETFRCRKGEVHLFIEGKGEVDFSNYRIPIADHRYFTATRKVVLKPGEQFTIAPNTKHWFVAMEDGAIVSEFSSNSDDESDIFTDPRIKRLPEY